MEPSFFLFHFELGRFESLIGQNPFKGLLSRQVQIRVSPIRFTGCDQIAGLDRLVLDSEKNPVS